MRIQHLDLLIFYILTLLVAWKSGLGDLVFSGHMYSAQVTLVTTPLFLSPQLAELRILALLGLKPINLGIFGPCMSRAR